MQKIILIVVAVAVVAGGGYYYFNSKNADQKMVLPTEVGATNADAAQPVAPSGKKMAFSEFIKQGGAYKCTVHQDVGGAASEGVTYINGDMIRGEYNTKVQGMSIDSTMIVRDGYTYSWSSMAPNMGFKVKVAANATSDTGASASGSYSFNASQIGDYNCVAWSVVPSKFEVPAGVTFKEISAK